MDFIPQWQEAQRHVHALAPLDWQKSTLLLQSACEAQHYVGIGKEMRMVLTVGRDRNELL